ncbi:hypothetical protein AB837_00556 [bacterium AB1]|nr:hypothetical protein AB837_00556 [bacterium AB1]
MVSKEQIDRYNNAIKNLIPILQSNANIENGIIIDYLLSTIEFSSFVEPEKLDFNTLKNFLQRCNLSKEDKHKFGLFEDSETKLKEMIERSQQLKLNNLQEDLKSSQDHVKSLKKVLQAKPSNEEINILKRQAELYKEKQQSEEKIKSQLEDEIKDFKKAQEAANLEIQRLKDIENKNKLQQQDLQSKLSDLQKCLEEQLSNQNQQPQQNQEHGDDNQDTHKCTCNILKWSFIIILIISAGGSFYYVKKLINNRKNKEKYKKIK